MNITPEVAFFRQELPRLLADPRNHGHFALVGAGRVAGIFAYFGDALDAGYKIFGLDAFMVGEIIEKQPPQHFPRNPFDEVIANTGSRESQRRNCRPSDPRRCHAARDNAFQYKAGYKFLEDGEGKGTTHAQVLDFPAVITSGSTLAVARDHLQTALLDVAITYIARGLALPLPNTNVSAAEMHLEEPIYLVLSTEIPAQGNS
jgi:predicted RNase H-like HicB family nuclease